MSGERLSYTLPEAAKATGLSVDTLYRKHHAGEITLRKFGGRTLILADELEAVVKALPAIPRHAA